MTTRNKNRLLLLCMIAPFLLTFAYIRVFVDLDDMGRNNKGTLIIPHVDFADLKPRGLNGAALNSDQINDRLAEQWTLLYIANGDCTVSCKNALFYLITQLRKSLDTDTPRVRRLIAHTRPAGLELQAFLDEKVSGMDEIFIDGVAAEHALVPFMLGESGAANHIYIVSPDGKIFIWYPTHEKMEDVLLEADKIRADLKRTLKGSLIG